MKIKGKEFKRQAREHLTGHYRVPMGAFILVNAMIMIIDSLFSLALGEPQNWAMLILTYVVDLLVLLISEVFSVGLIKIHLNLARGQEINTRMIYYGFKNHPDRFILGSLFIILFMIIPVAPATGSIVYYYYYDSSVTGILCMIGGSMITAILAGYVALNVFMLFYLLVDYPDMPLGFALKQTGKLMKGNRLKLLYIYLSFIGMVLLCVLSLGIGFLWVGPYISQTLACFYIEIMRDIQKEQKID